jgi:aspartyl-tRNA(Asn)/glutamyl-tRNA(Gln) amidotransferase subunit B
MEEGSLRCDANVSVRPRGAETLGTRTEVKNLNSFRNVARAIEHEAARQMAVLAAGGTIVQETRLWNAERGETVPMRSKEEAHDYRYFPEPDLPPLEIDDAWIASVMGTLPEMPTERQGRFMSAFGLPEYDAQVLTADRETAEYFEHVAREGGNPKAASNWVMTEVLRKLKDETRPLADCPVPPAHLAEMITLVDRGTISGKIAKDVFERMWGSGERAAVIVERDGLVQLSDADALRTLVAEIVAAHPDQVAIYRKGKAQTFGWFVGQVMRRTQGKANPQIVGELLRRALDPQA